MSVTVLYRGHKATYKHSRSQLPYRTTATESGGQIKFTGAIDVPEINREIADVMEGGVEAFKLRYQKYGFERNAMPSATVWN